MHSLVTTQQLQCFIKNGYSSSYRDFSSLIAWVIEDHEKGRSPYTKEELHQLLSSLPFDLVLDMLFKTTQPYIYLVHTHL